MGETIAALESQATTKEPFKSTVETQSFLQSFWSQLVIMMRRNTILQYRYLNATLAQVVIAPFVFTLLIFILQVADHNNQKISNPHPSLGVLDGVRKCQVLKMIQYGFAAIRTML
jgi:hypothetical protein